MKLRFLQLAVAASLAFAGTSSISRAQPVEPSTQAARDAAQDELRTLHLRAEDIKDELARTGRVVRRDAGKVGQTVADSTTDAQITAAIKVKLVADRDLSTLDISVNTTAGVVTFTGTAPSPEHIGKAMLLAMETAGAREVVSELGTAPVPAGVRRKEAGELVRRDEFGGIAVEEAQSATEVVGKLVRRGTQGEFTWLEKPKSEKHQAGATQIVEVEGMGLHSFPSGATPDEISEAINNYVKSTQERNRTAATVDFRPDPQPAPPNAMYQENEVFVVLVLGSLACLCVWIGIRAVWPNPSPGSKGRSARVQTTDGYVRSNCRFCGGSIEFPEHGLGEWVDCPHCNRRLQLRRMGATTRFFVGVRVWYREGSFNWKWASVLIAVMLVCGSGLFIYLGWKSETRAEAKQRLEQEAQKTAMEAQQAAKQLEDAQQRHRDMLQLKVELSYANELAKSAASQREGERLVADYQRKMDKIAKDDEAFQRQKDKDDAYYQRTMDKIEADGRNHQRELDRIFQPQASRWVLKYNSFSGRYQYVPPTAELKYNPLEHRWEWVP